MQTVNTAIFKGACAFTLTLRKMGNSRKGDIKKVEVDADKKRLRPFQATHRFTRVRSSDPISAHPLQLGSGAIRASSRKVCIW
jgi:hypothetical protein